MASFIPHFVRTLFLGRRERQLRELALAAQSGAPPLTLTEVCHPRFSVALPGVWREAQRTPDGCELASASGGQRLSIAVRSLLVPLQPDELADAGQRLLAERQRELASHGSIEWSEAATCRGEQISTARADGYQPGRRQLLAVVERVASEQVLSAVLSAPGDRLALPVFSNLATVLFDRLTSS